MGERSGPKRPARNKPVKSRARRPAAKRASSATGSDDVAGKSVPRRRRRTAAADDVAADTAPEAAPDLDTRDRRQSRRRKAPGPERERRIGDGRVLDTPEPPPTDPT